MNQIPTVKRCGVYTRKSSDENLNSDFTSLDAQRESCQAFIQSRKEEGWQVYPEQFADAALSGGNTKRPALQRLLHAVRQGSIQAVVVYKYDRLSRNIKDFVNILDLFDKHGVAFVSVTQQFDTSTSIGRIFQTMLMGFAQFERELVSERTRDKRVGMIQKGKWPGGMPIIGYDVNPADRGLIANPKESKQAKDQFLTYLQEKSLSRTARKLNVIGYRFKSWINKEGLPKGGGRYNKSNLDQILRNPLYIGKLRYKDKLFPGQHPAIVDEKLFDRVQKLLSKNDGNHKSINQDKHDFLLRSFIKCTACGSTMSPNFAYSKGRKYFYYKCVKVDKLDKNECSVRSVPAREVESLIVERLAFLGQNKKLVEKIVKEAQESSVKAIGPIREKKKRIESELVKIRQEANKLVSVLGSSNNGHAKNHFVLERLHELENSEKDNQTKVSEVEMELQKLENRMIDANVIRQNLQRFEAVFAKLMPNEKKELLRLLIKEIFYDLNHSKIKLFLRQLPDLGIQVDGDKISFDESAVWLPDKDSNLEPRLQRAVCYHYTIGQRFIFQ